MQHKLFIENVLQNNASHIPEGDRAVAGRSSTGEELSVNNSTKVNALFLYQVKEAGADAQLLSPFRAIAAVDQNLGSAESPMAVTGAGAGADCSSGCPLGKESNNCTLSQRQTIQQTRYFH